MRVELASLESEVGKIAHHYAAGELVLDDDRVVLAEAPTVSGRISRSEDKVVVKGDFAAIVKVECDRCLQPVDLPIGGDFRVEYVTAETYKSFESAELAVEELALSIFDGEFIDVDDLVREQLLLAIPTYAVCREECKGFCPVCSADRNTNECNCDATEIDPRWGALRDLRF